ncbi:MAG: DNA polymerase III subunit delta, partial [bacterium]
MTYQDNNHTQNNQANNNLAPIYLFYGDEEYLIQEEIKKICDKALNDSLRDFNLQKMEAEPGKASEIIDNASTLPFMSSKRVVIVSEGEKFNKKDQEILTRYFCEPNELTCLIIYCNEVDIKTEFYKNAKKKGVVSSFRILRGNQLLNWCQQKAREYNYQIDKEATNYLIDLIGNNLWQLDNEIKKLGIFLGEEKKITVAAIDELVSQMNTNTIFELTDLLGTKNLRQSLLLLHRILQ